MSSNISYLDKEYISEMLDNFSKATGLHIEAVNTFGENFLPNRECKKSEFCTHIQSMNGGKDL